MKVTLLLWCDMYHAPMALPLHSAHETKYISICQQCSLLSCKYKSYGNVSYEKIMVEGWCHSLALVATMHFDVEL